MQELIGDNKNEFTCGLFRSTTGQIRTIVLKRDLADGGYSSYGEVVHDPAIEQLLLLMADSLSLVGSINVQLRIGPNGPTIFEINPRFSSTIMFRNMLGFKDVLWCIEDALGLTLSLDEKRPIGKRFYKGFTEYID